MKKVDLVDYLQAVRDFDKAQGKKPDDFEVPLKCSMEVDSEGDYLAVSRGYER